MVGVSYIHRGQQEKESLHNLFLSFQALQICNPEIGLVVSICDPTENPKKSALSDFLADNGVCKYQFRSVITYGFNS